MTGLAWGISLDQGDSIPEASKSAMSKKDRDREYIRAMESFTRTQQKTLEYVDKSM
jgi:hypothetical protein